MSLVITGANGELGRGVLDAVAALAPDAHLVAAVRDPARSADLVERGIDVRPGSFDDAGALATAFEGAETVFVNATFFGDTRLREARVSRAIAAAAGAGARRLVVTSWPDLEHDPQPLVQDYVGIERAARTAGPDWTVLRYGYGLADAVARDVGWARRDGALVAPAAGARATPAALVDLVDATAAVLVGVGHGEKVYELTGPRAVDWTEVAALASEIDGRELPFRPVDDDAYRAHLEGLGLPAAVVDGLLGLYAAFRSGWASHPDPALGELVGRAPVDTIEAVRRRVRG